MATTKENIPNIKLSKQNKVLIIYSWESEKGFLFSTQQVVLKYKKYNGWTAVEPNSNLPIFLQIWIWSHLEHFSYKWLHWPRYKWVYQLRLSCFSSLLLYTGALSNTFYLTDSCRNHSLHSPSLMEAPFCPSLQLILTPSFPREFYAYQVFISYVYSQIHLWQFYLLSINKIIVCR